MNSFKVLKRNSHESPALTQQMQKDKVNLWGKRSLIFNHSNAQLF